MVDYETLAQGDNRQEGKGVLKEGRRADEMSDSGNLPSPQDCVWTLRSRVENRKERSHCYHKFCKTLRLRPYVASFQCRRGCKRSRPCTDSRGPYHWGYGAVFWMVPRVIKLTQVGRKENDGCWKEGSWLAFEIPLDGSIANWGDSQLYRGLEMFQNNDQRQVSVKLIYF